jgi:hypothetical protein
MAALEACASVRKISASARADRWAMTEIAPGAAREGVGVPGA